MKITRSAGTVVFRRDKEGNVLYLLLKAHYKTETWGLPKGALEANESIEDAALRETLEETGITDIEFLPGFQEQIKYTYIQDGELINKEVYFFISEPKSDAVTISTEHVGYKWVSFEEALKVIKYPNLKKVLRRAKTVIAENKF